MYNTDISCSFGLTYMSPPAQQMLIINKLVESAFTSKNFIRTTFPMLYAHTITMDNNKTNPTELSKNSTKLYQETMYQMEVYTLNDILIFESF